MTKYQKQTIQYSLEEEQKILKSLQRSYKEAGKTIESRIKNLLKREDADLIHVVHQVKYQKALKSQIDDVLDKLNDGTISTIQKYMDDSYGTGFTSSLFRLQKQGVPLLFPMDREEILRSVQLNSKISKQKYGSNFIKMKNAIRKEVTRGVSTSMSFGDIARNIDNTMQSGLYNSYRVARTEGHRINQEASFDAMTKAKEAGADIVKQWDSTLDSRTRPHHSQLNGQVRELDDPFEVAGKSAQHPSGFGVAAEDINCRCVVLEIGRWELDEDDTYSKFDGDLGTIVSDLSNVSQYAEFQKEYYKTLLKADQKNLVMLNQKSYSGIWKDTVYPSDYAAKKGSIQAKKDYFNEQIAKGNKVPQFQKALDDLDDFEKQGIEYEKIKERIEDTKNSIAIQKNRLGIDLDEVEDVFSQDRKDEAYWFTQSNGGAAGADKVLRSKSGEVWRNSTEAEKDAMYEYTHTYSRINEPLRGYEYGTNKFLGVGNVDLDDIGVSYKGYKKGFIHDKINKMTDVISRSSYDFDLWVQRGCRYTGMDKFLGIDDHDLRSLSGEELAQRLVGTTPIEYGFMSTGVAKGSGFSGDIILNIYAPSETKMMYVEPFSRFGNGSGRSWDGISEQSSIGYEAEMLFQRETKFMITKVERTNGMIYIDMDVIEQGY